MSVQKENSAHEGSATSIGIDLFGIDGELVLVQADVSQGRAGFTVVGLPEGATRETRLRVRSALAELDIDLSHHAIAITFQPHAPADAGPFDLSVAIAVLGALGVIPPDSFGDIAFVGELSFSGKLQRARGLLPRLLHLRRRAPVVMRAVVPAGDEREAALVHGLDVRASGTLSEVVSWLQGGEVLSSATGARARDDVAMEDLADIPASWSLERRALEVAAAGGHNLILVGPPGAPKTMLARRLAGILPALSREEEIEVMSLHSAAGLLGAPHARRPFRAPHHTIGDGGLVGAGARFGEASLAHSGVLFLEDLPEFRRVALERLRRVVDARSVYLSSDGRTATVPTCPMLVGTMTACPCGYRGDGTERCRCTSGRIQMYVDHVHLLDQFDLRVTVAPRAVRPFSEEPAEASAVVAARVDAARARQRARGKGGQGPLNASCTGLALGMAAPRSEDAASRLAELVELHDLTLTGFDRILRVARTIADLAASSIVEREHIDEAAVLCFPVIESSAATRTR